MKKFIYPILLLAFIGAILAGILLFQHYYPLKKILMITCGDANTNPCLTLTQSGFSSLLGIPLAAFGLFAYVFIIFTLLIADYAEEGYYRGALLLLTPVAALALVADVALAGILIALQTFCTLCVITYVINAALLLLFVLWLRAEAAAGGTGMIALYREALAGAPAIDTPDRKAALSSYTLFIILLAFAIFSTSQILRYKSGGGEASNGEPKREALSQEKLVAALDNFYNRQEDDIILPEKGLVLGDPNAPLTIAAYTDFLCSACFEFYKTEKELLKKYNGKVRFVYYNFPLDQSCNGTVQRTVYANSCIAARAAITAWKLGVYETFLTKHFAGYHNYSHNYSATVAIATLKEALRAKGKPVPSDAELEALLNAADANALIADHLKVALMDEINATPTIFVAGRKLEGVPHPDFLDALIRIELKKLGTE